ncbi:hypothetical protein DMN91_011929 [Ooceraea biroi]|uniref:Uncharacterized protein n=1 Tax=Ooceraea biroi TaxID=2015173 RepID=A0A3L8D7A2_OOCBI|nr:uncharacterized protein LOC105283360 [Ooceraea biroi]RLU16169.1 hypothetical protein DMN91_011929 [Ooceraea biroi]
MLSRRSLLDYKIMASRRYVPLRVILIAICLDISSIVVATVSWDSKTPRYDSYNLDKGPVIYKAYYPDTRKSHQEKPYFDQNTVLETSFQMPSDQSAYSTETADRPIWNNESSVVANDERRILSKEQWKVMKTRRNYNFTNEFDPFHDKQSLEIFDGDKDIENVNIKEISKLVRRAISRDLENWNALERYLGRTSNQAQPISQSEMYFKKSHENEKNYNYPFEINQRTFNPSQQLRSKVLQKLETRDVEQLQPTYLEEVDASEIKDTMKDEAIVNGMQAADASSVNVISDSSMENIFQPRPQLIRYMFFRKLTPQRNEQIEKVTDELTLRNYGDDRIHEAITNDSRNKQVKENVKITSIEVSKLPRHKIRHHHDEWPKRHYSTHRYRAQSTVYPINTEK